jgi:hypothetical protein
MHFLFSCPATWRPAAGGGLLSEIADVFALGHTLERFQAQILARGGAVYRSILVTSATRKNRTPIYHGFRGFHGCKDTEIPIREISAIRGCSSSFTPLI